MRALRLETADGPSSVRLAEIDAPAPAAGEVLVRVHAAAFNHRELWITRGQYPGMRLPTTLGADGAGVVEAVGDGVDAALVGRAVVFYPGWGWGDDPRLPAADFGLLGMPGPGTMADAVVLPADHILPKPEHLDFVEAAAIPLASLTAWRGLTTKAGLTRGARLLVTGAGGGVASAAIALGRALGAEVWVTSGSDETIAWAVAQGAAGGVNYKSEGWPKSLARSLPPIDVVLDGAPASSFAAYGRALAPGARVVIYGSTGGASFPVVAPELFLKNVQVSGTNVGNPQEFAAMLDFVAAEKLRPAIDRVFPFDRAAEALAYLDTAHGIGKVVVAMAES